MKHAGQKTDRLKESKTESEYLKVDNYMIVVSSLSPGEPVPPQVRLIGHPETSTGTANFVSIFFVNDTETPQPPSFSGKIIFMHLHKWQMPQVIEILRNGTDVRCEYHKMDSGVTKASLVDRSSKTPLVSPLSVEELLDLPS